MKLKLIIILALAIALTNAVMAQHTSLDSILLKTKKDTVKKTQEIPELEIKFDKSKLATQSVRMIFNDLFKQYVTIKDALAYNDPFSAKRNTLALLEMMKTKMQDNDVVNKDDRWKIFLHNYDNIHSKIDAADDISEQRFLFGVLSHSIKEFIKSYGLNDKTIYIMECNDVAKNVNSSWLSDSRDKKNPYLGLINDTACAKVKEVWVF